MEDLRGLTFHFIDGTKMSLEFPKQTSNTAAAQLKFNDVLATRYVMLDVDGTLFVIPFENIKYMQIYPAPASIQGHTYITGATVVG
jgi:hypothetical protein